MLKLIDGQILALQMQKNRLGNKTFTAYEYKEHTGCFIELTQIDSAIKELTDLKLNILLSKEED